jgi:nitrile hydratase accessory protein
VSTLDITGPAAPPRLNGELVFAEPWESRAFGLAVSLHAGGAFEWEDFRRELVAAIAAWEAGHQPGEQYSYYRCWLAALEELLASEGLVEPRTLEARLAELANHPPGHDHGHG